MIIEKYPVDGFPDILDMLNGFEKVAIIFTKNMRNKIVARIVVSVPLTGP